MKLSLEQKRKTVDYFSRRPEVDDPRFNTTGAHFNTIKKKLFDFVNL